MGTGVAHLGELSFHLWPAASATSLAPPGRIQQLTGQTLPQAPGSPPSTLSGSFLVALGKGPQVALKGCQLLLPEIKSSLCWGWTPRSFYLGSCGWMKPSCERLSSVITRTSWGSSQTACKQTVGLPDSLPLLHIGRGRHITYLIRSDLSR